MIKLMPGLAAAGLVLSLMSASAFAAPAGSDNTQRPAQIVRVAQMPKYVKPQFKRKKVHLMTTEAAGTVIIDTNNKYLYLVEGNNRATRYGIGVGRDGFGWSGIVKIGRKAEWPAWTPPAEMRRREAAKGHIIPAYQEGGEDNPLGARAMYLYQGGRDTIFRIHGTNQPWTIGLNMSSGCIRMMNEDVTHLYDRAPVGTKVIVIGPGNKQGKVAFEDRGIDVLRTMFGG
ncbi:UNVERIFIED_ORG: lipoprotein-anchoring transpeptidase ErfK/SrfK [Rhizobium esperanzae]|uniref:L,D-transpeptidase n=1 Tax=Rhizobium phaseoli TaxID=396 RepID=A0A192T4A3_9HYPH|nr:MULTISPECIES: L,D-transpeptidase [Rhizobium]MDH6649968.1 lipoprotein-anchoring transpeptidase ErfK/SrfK [Rhizobium esperanzae]ANL39308.1 L,D-transpeptidase domain-containing protein [Rhizobium phaseoli]ANL52041.1 L,D-transpeptidase domain-containing protein [Rhizobium phaseoli]ANL58297.1 L,D-transpeptidase domain-containing protein [Rhizobium phaseoli]ANL83655.1 L,D-transpeptidase domain-containing protein [Rhizobium phaseoli]